MTTSELLLNYATRIMNRYKLLLGVFQFEVCVLSHSFDVIACNWRYE